MTPGKSERLLAERKNEERRKTIFVFLVGSVLAAPPYTYLYWKLGSPGASLAIVAFAPLLLLVFLLRRILPQMVAINSVMGMGFVIFSISAFFTGGIEGPALYWSVVVPIAAVILCGERIGLFWLGAVLFQISVFYWGDRLGYRFIQQYTEHAALDTAIYASMIGIAVFAFAIAGVSERFKRFYLTEIEAKNRELAEALESIKTLKGLLPICAWCKKIRNDQGYWDKLETFLSHNADVKFSHGMCPDCAEKEIKRLKTEQEEGPAL